MPHPDYRRCKNCGRHADECGVLSWQRLCEDCGDELRYSNWQAMLNRTGPEWAKWRRSMAACVGAVLSDTASERR